MKMLKISGVFLIFAMSLSSSPSWAKSSKKVTPEPEIYPAFEPEFEVPAPPAPQPAKKTASTPATPRENEKFEKVPDIQSEPVIRRLKLVEDLIRRHGRAYDYRAHTLQELQNILARLDRESPKTEFTLPDPPASSVSVSQ